MSNKFFGQHHLPNRRAFVNVWVAMAQLGILLLCYKNSFHASWQYDDFGNIVSNLKIHMDQWSWSQIKQSFSAGLEFQIISRPLAYLSFALNHKIGGLNVFGYHVVNFAIHWITTLFLFFFIRGTLNLPIFRDRYAGHATIIAAIASVFWATHPIQVTAVTYIVQRMASMAGMFYIMALYFFMKGRSVSDRTIRGLNLFLCAIVAVCALLTKENTLMLGYAILFYDLFLIQGIHKESIRHSFMAILGMTLIAAIVGALYMDMDFGGLVASYKIRAFSMAERVLTQPRVLFFYLSLIAVPMTSRMAMLHDIEISHSLMDPWTTSAAIAGLLASIIALALTARKYPFFSFCGLFFLLNHAMEGSILNLELIYEHRNYIPTMLIFVPPAVAVVKSLSFFHYRRFFQWMLGGAVMILLVSNSYTTFAYNRYFKTELSLWLHTVQCSPSLSLAHNNLGTVYWSMNLRDQAQKEFEKAFHLDRYNNSFHEGSVSFNLGLYEAYQKYNFKEALRLLSKAKELYPKNYRIWFQLGIIQLAKGDCEGAKQTVSSALEHWALYPDLYYLSALVCLKSQDYSQAIQDAEHALKIRPNHPGALMVLGQSYKFTGQYDLSIGYWERFIIVEPKDLHGIIALIELYSDEGKFGVAEKYYQRFLDLKGDQTLESVLEIARKSAVFGAYVPDPFKMRQLLKNYSLLNHGSSENK